MRNLFISGGSRGIGASLAKLAARRGYRVILSYNKEADLASALVANIKQQGGEAACVQLDTSDYSAVIDFFENFEQQYGELNAMVNNAGIVDLSTRMEHISPVRLQRIFAVNVYGTFYCCQQAVKLMSTRHGKKGGVIVKLSSVASRLGSPNEYVDYAAAKAAVDDVTGGR